MATKFKKTLKSVLNLVEIGLKSEGFIRKNACTLVSKQASDLEFVFILTYHAYSDGIVFDPLIGVYSNAIEKLAVHLRCPRTSSMPVTIAHAMSDVIKGADHLRWFCSYNKKCNSIAKRIVRDVRKYGLPCIKRYLTIDRQLIELRNRAKAKNIIALYRFPVACLVAGKNDAALNSVSTSLKIVKSGRDPWSKGFQKFATKVRIFVKKGRVVRHNHVK